MEKMISIVIPTYGRSSYLKKTLANVLNQEVKSFEVLLVDNNPDNETINVRKEITDHRLKILRETKKGSNVARNRGINEAQGEYIAFLDDDAVPQENWLNNLVNCLVEEGALAVGGRTLPDWERKPPRWIINSKHAILGIYDQGEERREVYNYIITANMIIRKEVIQKVGYFNTTISRAGTEKSNRFKMIKSYDDVEFAKRIMQHGKIFYEPSAVVYHRIQSNRFSLGYQCRINFGNSYAKASVHHKPSIKNFMKKASGPFLLYDTILATFSAMGYLCGRLNTLLVKRK